MNKFDIVIPVSEFTIDELADSDRRLVEAAIEATSRAYAPYSHFNVGAAIRLDNGETVTGSNQENAAFPSGTCAERTTCYYAHSRWPGARFEAIAIAAVASDGEIPEEPVSPCGACRQALLEYETLGGREIRVLLVGRNRVCRLKSVRALLPFAFSEF
ncbi:MAG: cytidine deaminase [Clostridium sp.]|nr:cytidine deaminase [Clostridium sp.]